MVVIGELVVILDSGFLVWVGGHDAMKERLPDVCILVTAFFWEGVYGSAAL